jgi:mannosyltransferase OCH1-like enzyme
MKRINSWIDKHTDRDYKLRGNKELEEIDWINKKAIEYYKSHGKRAGVADCMRYEILYKYG